MRYVTSVSDKPVRKVLTWLQQGMQKGGKQ